MLVSPGLISTGKLIRCQFHLSGGPMNNPIRLFEDYFTEPIIKELEYVRDSIKPTLDNNILIHFTEHNVNHSDRMIKILKEIIDENLSYGCEKKLCESELFILILSIYLHDIGMQIPQAHKINKPLIELTDKDYNKIRENHGEISAEILDEIVRKRQTLYGISIDLTKPLIKNSINIVIEIISKHQSSKQYDPKEILELSGEKIRIGILTGLLRIIDQLDCSHDRVNVEKLHQYSIPKTSIMHWVACHYIDSVSVENGDIKIVGSSPDSFPPPYIDFLNKQLIDKINSELYYETEETSLKSELWKNKIKINFNNKVGKQENRYSTARWSSLPDWVIGEIQNQLISGPPKYTQSLMHIDIQKRDWMSYWGFIGNPFLDHPLAYGSEHLIETNNITNICGEIESHINSKKGDVRLLIGERGLGKTTLFQVIKGKFETECQVNIIDAADIATSVNTPTELYNKLFERTNNVFGDESEFSKDNFFEKINKSKLRIICIDSLDRLPPEKANILDNFFKQSQHILTYIKNKIIFIISCSNEWEQFLNSKELSYLGTKNQWTLDKFSTENSRMMLTKRLESSGKSLNQVFADNAIAPLHTMSNANPRDILANAENACRLAFKQNKKIIDLHFIQNEYENNLETAYNEFLKEKCADPTFKNGLTAIYWYFIDIDRRNLDRNLGIDILSQMADHEVRKDISIFQYSVAIGYVAKISTKEENGKSIVYYILRDEVKKFFKILKSNGFTTKDFLSFYSLQPEIPAEYREDLTEPLNVMDKSSEHFYYHDKARTDYIDIVKGNVTYAYNVYKKSWDVLENIMVAILIKINKLNPQDYESMKQEVFYEDRKYGIPRYKKEAVQLLIDQSHKLSKDFITINKEKKYPFIHNWNSVLWIRNTRNNVLKASTSVIHKFADQTQLNLCKGHLEQSYRELEDLYRKIEEIK